MSTGNLCNNCSSLNLSIHDFIPDQSDDEPDQVPNRRGSWIPVKEARLGTTIREVIQRHNCPLCRLAVKAFETTSSLQVNESVSCKVSLMRTELVWNDWTEEGWRPVFLGFNFSHSPGIDILFAPTVENAIAGGSSTSQYFTRHVSDMARRCELLRSWLTACEHDHAGDCYKLFHTVLGIPNFYLIDVRDRCLVVPSTDCRYVALSYVWGSEPFFCTTTSNIESLQLVGGLSRSDVVLPKTIKDAIIFVEQSGERFLWVDSICIVQDDVSHMEKTIPLMGVIYGNALYTIVAMTNEKADDGLFCNERTRFRAGELIKPGLTLQPVPLYQGIIEHENWFHEQRGWTFQEVCLSRRIVTFINGDIFFTCQKMSMREDLATEDSEADKNDIIKVTSTRGLQTNMDPYEAFSEYIFSVEIYSSRDLTFFGDKLDAFEGVSKILGDQMKTPMLLGLPVALIDLALLWEPHDGVTRNEIFPSWTWAGWFGGAYLSGMRGDQSQFLVSHTWIEWYHYSKDANQFVPLRDSVKGTQASEPSMSLYYQRYNRILGWPDPIRRQLTDLPTTPLLTMPTDPADIQHPAGILRFFSITAIFDVRYDKSGRDILLVDRLGRRAGWLAGGTLGEHSGTTDLSGRYDIILLSERMNGGQILAPEVEEQEDESISDAQQPAPTTPRNWRDPNLSANWNLYNIMMVSWKDEVAYRVAIGCIYKPSLAYSFSPGPEWQLINLG